MRSSELSTFSRDIFSRCFPHGWTCLSRSEAVVLQAKLAVSFCAVLGVLGWLVSQLFLYYGPSNTLLLLESSVYLKKAHNHTLFLPATVKLLILRLQFVTSSSG